MVLLEQGRWFYVLGGAALIVLLEAAAEFRDGVRRRQLEIAKEDLIRMRTEFDVVFGDQISPLADLIGRIAEADDPYLRKQLLVQLSERATSTALRLCGTAQRARAVFYELDETGEVLEQVAWVGRQDPPRNTFQKGDRSGNHVFRLLEAREELLVPNTEHPDPGIPPLVGRQYKTYIMAPVSAGQTRFGVLFVDAPQPGELTAMHLRAVGTVAQLLGTGLCLGV